MWFMSDEEGVGVGDGAFVVDGEGFKDEGDSPAFGHVFCFGGAAVFATEGCHPFDTT